MLVRIRFGKPLNATPSPSYEGVVIAFPFTIERPGVGARRDKVSQYRIDVSIENSRRLTWGLPGNPLLERATLFEYALESVLKKLRDRELKKHEKVRLHVLNTPNEYPFDPAKLTDPNNCPEYEVDLDDARQIGFKLPGSGGDT